MKLLLDANLSPRVAVELTGAGYDASHVAHVGLTTAADEAIFDFAATNGLVLITADSDFSMLLAVRNASRPSVVLLRHVAELRWPAHTALLSANLGSVSAELREGAIVSLSPSRLSIRRLPIGRNAA